MFQRKIYIRIFLGKKMTMLSVILFFVLSVFAQKKKTLVHQTPFVVSKIVSYEILENGDTINKLDNKQFKQGFWLHYSEGRFGEQSYYEYGAYDNNVRVGKWLVYDNDGRTQSEEFYKSGLKSGEAKYYDNGKLYCIGNYLALDSKYDYDTIMVEDPITNITRPVVVKADVGSVRHGVWTYFDIRTSKIDRVVDYQLDEIIYEKDYSDVNSVDSTFAAEKIKAQPHNSNKAPANVWFFDKSKKPSKFTDIPDNVESVKPNVRKKTK
jgi:hypothetical protein